MPRRRQLPNFRITFHAPYTYANFSARAASLEDAHRKLAAAHYRDDYVIDDSAIRWVSFAGEPVADFRIDYEKYAPKRPVVVTWKIKHGLTETQRVALAALPMHERLDFLHSHARAADGAVEVRIEIRRLDPVSGRWVNEVLPETQTV